MGGKLRRLGVAQALLNIPCLLIFGKPTTALVPENRIGFRSLFTAARQCPVHGGQSHNVLLSRLEIALNGRLRISGVSRHGQAHNCMRRGALRDMVFTTVCSKDSLAFALDDQEDGCSRR